MSFKYYVSYYMENITLYFDDASIDNAKGKELISSKRKKHKDYMVKYRQLQSQPILCGCGGIFRAYSKANHKKTDMHRRYLCFIEFINSP